MNYIQRLAVLSFTAVSILGLSACTTTAVLTPEEALKKDTDDQIYSDKQSLASNICDYMGIFCPKDVTMSEAEFEKMVGSEKAPNTGIEISKLGGVMLASSWLFPTSLATQTHQLGAGWFFLGAGLLQSAITPSDWKNSRVLAFVTVDKAKTAEEARKYFLDNLIAAEKKVIKANHFEIVKEWPLQTKEFSDHTTTFTNIAVKGKDVCPLNEKNEQTCIFDAAVVHGGLNAVKTVIPNWLPNGGQEAWRISRTGAIFRSEPYRISKVIQKDLVIQVAEKLPDNFYVYVPATDVGDEKKDGPAFIMTNKTVYPFIYVFNKDK